jgi:hypothetical protein
MKYLVIAIFIFVLLFYVSTRGKYLKMDEFKSDSQYPVSDLLISQKTPKNTFLSDALKSSLGQ